MLDSLPYYKLVLDEFLRSHKGRFRKLLIILRYFYLLPVSNVSSNVASACDANSSNFSFNSTFISAEI